MNKGLRRHSNACKITNTKLSFPEHVSQSGLCATCIMCGLCEIGRKAKEGKTVFPEPFGTAQFGAEKITSGLEDLQFVPELFGEGICFREAITETEIGGFKVKLPVSIAGVGSTIVAHRLGGELASGAAKAGITAVIGENVISTHGEEGLKQRIKPFLDSYGKHGAIIVQGNVEDRKQGIFEKALSFGAMGIELKLGQGAKQGMGGEIKFSSKEDAEKYKKIGYTIIQESEELYQRHSDPGSLSEEGLRESILQYKDLGVPIWIKIAVGKGIIKFLEAVEKVNKEEKNPVKCVTIDGLPGGTGMSPWLIMNESGLPSASVFSALNKKMSYDILLAGGFANGMDIGKAMMLGASGAAMARPFLIAAKTDKEKGIENYCKALTEEMQMLCATQRAKAPGEFIGRKDSLFALSDEAAKMFGVNNDPSKVL